MCKLPLEINPLAMMFEFIWLRTMKGWRYELYRILIRFSLCALALCFALVIPNFQTAMGFVGALFAFGISVIFPCMSYLRLFDARIALVERVWLWFVIVISVVMMLMGTVWVMLPASVVFPAGIY